MPWLRYFFPAEFDVREGAPGAPTEPYFQYFDVRPQPLQEDTSMPPPAWAPNAYFKLSFTQLHVPKDMVLATRMPQRLLVPGAVDLSGNNAMLLQPGNEERMREIIAFCRSVATFRACTWEDAMPLVDLLRGLLDYLLQHYAWGAALLRETAKKEAEAGVQAEKASLREWYQGQLDEVAAKARREYDSKLDGMREQLRMTLAEDLTKDLRAEREEKERLRQQVASLEAQLRKGQEVQASLDRQVAHLNHQAEDAAKRSEAALAAKDAAVAGLRSEAEAAAVRMAAMQRCVLDALNAKTKGDAMDVAMAAVAASVNGSSVGVYIAELRTAADADAPDPSALLAAEVAAAAGDAGAAGAGSDDASASGRSLSSAMEAMRAVTPGFLSCPLSSLVGGGLGGESASSSRPATPQRGSAAGARMSGTGGATAGGAAAVASAAASEIKETLVWKYIKASPDQAFMLGQRLPWGRGVSWSLVDGAKSVQVADVGTRTGVHFFRPPASTPGGEAGRVGASYHAVPVVGVSGEVVGMVCVDTVGKLAGGGGGAAAAAGGLRSSDVSFLQGVAAAISVRAQSDQEALEEAMLALTLAAHSGEQQGEPAAAAAVDPAAFAGGDGISGALKLFKDSLRMLEALGDEELGELRELEQPDDATLAVLRSVLCAAGCLTGSGGEAQWAAMRGHVTHELLQRLQGLDPQAAWAEWQVLCATFRPLSELPGSGPGSLADVGSAAGDASAAPGARAGAALARWAAAVRTVSAARAVQAALEAKLRQANAVLIKTFSGDGCHALNELRSYRVPPPITSATLQCVLLLAGHEEDDCRNWARMRALTTYKLIKALVTLRPAQVGRRVFKAVRKLVTELAEDDVRKESVATLSLYRWLNDFSRLASVV